MYTDIGWKNHRNWIDVGGFDNYLFTPNGKLHRHLTRRALINILHPFQPFILGQKNFIPQMAYKFNIPLIFYGESPSDYGTKMGNEKIATTINIETTAIFKINIFLLIIFSTLFFIFIIFFHIRFYGKTFQFYI